MGENKELNLYFSLYNSHEYSCKKPLHKLLLSRFISIKKDLLEMNEPLIILGMHRSGTSMLTRVLRHQGIFLGHKIQGDDEALYFLKLNRWMLHMAGTDWDRPIPAIEMLEDPIHVERLADFVKTRMHGMRTYDYFGPKFLQSKMRIDSNLPFKWGFKDPRTSIMLPVWNQIFPKAKFLRIRRHGIDVAASLQTRYMKHKPHLGNYRKLTKIGITLPLRNRTIDTIRCNTIEGALGIWQEYENILDKYLADIDSNRQMTLKYEDYLNDISGHHNAISNFIGVNMNTSLPDDIKPDPSRAFAYKNKPELLTEAEKFSDILKAQGY